MACIEHALFLGILFDYFQLFRGEAHWHCPSFGCLHASKVMVQDYNSFLGKFWCIGALTMHLIAVRYCVDLHLKSIPRVSSHMGLRCLQCAGDLRNKVMVTRLGDIDVWFCDGCNMYFDKKEIKSIICSA